MKWGAQVTVIQAPNEREQPPGGSASWRPGVGKEAFSEENAGRANVCRQEKECVCVCVCVCACVCIMCSRAHMCARICGCMHMCARVSICASVDMCACVPVCACVSI